METLCRLCATSSPSLESIFIMENGQLLSDLVSVVCQIKIEPTDWLPKTICQGCRDIVISANSLREISILNDVRFRSGEFLADEELDPVLKLDEFKRERSIDIDDEVEMWEEPIETIEVDSNSDDEYVVIAIEADEHEKETVEKIQLKKPKGKTKEDKKQEASTGRQKLRRSLKLIEVALKNRANNSAPKAIKAQVPEALPTSSKSEFWCIYCRKSFNALGAFVFHYNYIHKLNHYRPFECSECGLRVWTEKILNIHQHYIHLNCTEMRRFCCEICGFEDKVKLRLEEHMLMQHLPHLPRQHNESIINKKPLCPLCFRIFAGSSSLQKHMRCVHQMLVTRNQNPELFHQEKNFFCDSCGSHFSLKSSIEKHMQCHQKRTHKHKKLNCECCDKEFANNKLYKSHRKSHTKYETLLKPKTFWCNTCNLSFETELLMSEHFKSDHAYNSYDCYHFPCRQKFLSRNLFRKHVKASHIALKANPFTGKFHCTVPGCQRKFNTASGKRRHVLLTHFSKEEIANRSKTASRDFLCFRCAKTFTTKRALKNHLANHKAYK